MMVGRRTVLLMAGKYLVLLALCVPMVVPIIWVTVTSLKPEPQIYAFPPRWIPWPMSGEHYARVWNSRMPRYFLNSLVTASATVIVTLAVGVHAAYAVSRFEFPGKRVFLFSLIASEMMPGAATLVPVFLIAGRLGLLNTYFVLILVYSAWQTPLVVWFMQGILDNVPSNLDRAAMVDGHSRIGVLYRVILPLSKPGIAAAAIMVFIAAWNEFILALILTSSDDMRLVPVAMYYYISQYGIVWGELTASAVLSIIPVVCMFVVLQKWFIYGMTSGALKG
jgi:ABC-type glycerol-3-phosphate transport system permease component